MSCDFIALANAGVQGLRPYQAGKPIEELERELGLKDVVKLASNENPLGPSPKAVAVAQAAVEGVHLYPDSNGFELKKALAANTGLSLEQITLGNGSNDVLDLIARVFLEPGKSAVYSEHAFVVYPIAVQACGARAIVTPAKDWGHDLDAMAAAIEDDTRVVFIANPNNPTGTWLSEQAIRAFMAKVPENVVVVLDEAYTEYVEEGDYPDGVELLADYPNMIVTRTFSKAYGLAGLRVGYGLSSASLADLLNRVRGPFNVNNLALACATASLADADYLQRARSVNRDGLAQVAAGLEVLGLPFIPSVGNFISFETHDVGGAAEGVVDAGKVYQALLERAVIVRPVGVYKMPNYLRVSIGLAEENERFLAALPEAMAAARSAS